MIKLSSLLNEGFDLDPYEANLIEKLAKYMSSFFMSDLKNAAENANSDDKRIKFNIDYNSAKKFRNETENIFETKKLSESTYWGQSSLIITTKNEELPPFIVYITNGYTAPSDGYVLEPPQDISKIYILLDKFSFVNSFTESIEYLTEILSHEYRHYIQLHHNIGLPKQNILSKIADPLGGIRKDDETGYKRLPHHMRDVEFKTNLHTYAFKIKNALNKTYPKNEWKTIFKNIIVLGKGIPGKDDDVNHILDNLDDMRKKDFPRWKQFIKELYKEIFKSEPLLETSLVDREKNIQKWLDDLVDSAPGKDRGEKTLWLWNNDPRWKRVVNSLMKFNRYKPPNKDVYAAKFQADKYYIRFGRLPKTGKSTNHLVGKLEKGVSAYPAKWSTKHNMWELDTSELSEIGISTLDSMINDFSDGKGRSIYLIYGQQLMDMGIHDTEPLLDINKIKIIKELKPNEIWIEDFDGNTWGENM